MAAFSAVSGAVEGAGGILHFGDPLREQRLLASGEALAPLGDRTVVSVTGPDRLTWLDSITSQALTALTPGESTELLILDPQGRVEHAAAVLEDGETTWLIADADDASPLAGWLRRMVFRSQVTVTEEALPVVGFVPGGSAERALEAAAHRPAGVPLTWHDPWSGVSAGGWQYAQVEEHPGAQRLWAESIVSPRDHPALAEHPAAGLLAVEALRIAAWRPRWANEVDERSIPHESDWIRTAVHLSKGCYRGQETVAKVHNLGHPPRRLAMLHLDGSESALPEKGAEVHNGDAVAGHLTSVAMHHELGPIALAILTRRTPADATLVVDVDGASVAAAQEVIVPADAGATADVPRLTRLSRRPAKG